jgi:hypothetical protein
MRLRLKHAVRPCRSCRYMPFPCGPDVVSHPKVLATPMTAMTTYWNVRLPVSAIVNVA